MAQVCEGAPPTETLPSLGSQSSGAPPHRSSSCHRPLHHSLRRQTNTRDTPLTALKAGDPPAACMCRTPPPASSAGHAFSSWAFGAWPAAASAPQCGPDEQSLTQAFSPPEQPSLLVHTLSGCTTLHSSIHSFIQQTLPGHIWSGHCWDPESTQPSGTDLRFGIYEIERGWVLDAGILG